MKAITGGNTVISLLAGAGSEREALASPKYQAKKHKFGEMSMRKICTSIKKIVGYLTFWLTFPIWCCLGILFIWSLERVVMEGLYSLVDWEKTKSGVPDSVIKSFEEENTK